MLPGIREMRAAAPQGFTSATIRSASKAFVTWVGAFPSRLRKPPCPDVVLAGLLDLDHDEIAG